MDFTKSQQLAIDLRDRHILVSAAAGSGKTATLTERILRLLTDKENPADISSMLIVTFTRAAAGELRTRISKKLADALAEEPSNHHLARQLTALSSARICTIDAYYLDLIRSNFQRLGIPAKFRLADETELQILRHETMNAVIERRYDTDEAFSSFADEITTAKGESRLSDTLLDVSKKIVSTPEGTALLAESARKYIAYKNKDFFETAPGITVYKNICDEVAYLLKKAERLIGLIDAEPCASPYGKAVAADRDFLYSFTLTLAERSYSKARIKILDYKAEGMGSVSDKNKNETTVEVYSERNEIKGRILKLGEREFATHPDDLSVICARSAELCLKLKEVLDDFFSAYDNEKTARSVMEFSDLRKLALKTLVDENGNPTQTAIEERKKFEHIFVDEYQDTDAVQDLVFRTISNGKNLFFVGDIKQSIYSFRGAEPSVFSAYRKAYLPAEGRESTPEIPLSVFMSENFRCSPNIISFTNAVCSYLFRETEWEGGGIGYVSEDDLIASRSEPICKDKVRIVFLEEHKKKEEDKGCNIEYAFVISEIKNLLKCGCKPDGKPTLARDIAILTRSNKEAAAMAEALAKAGIPYANSAGDDLFENPEVLLMLSLLSVADNPQRDVPLAAVLRSPLFGFTLGELVNIRSGRTGISLFDALVDYRDSDSEDENLKNKSVSAVDKIINYRAEAESMPVHLFMRYLWNDTNALSYAGSDKSSKKRTPIERRRNLRKFYEYARRYEATSYKGLHDFVEYVNGIISQKTKISEEDAVTDNTVQVMTVHKSKGLEFPVVFMIGCAKRSTEQDSRKNLIFTATDQLSVAFRISDSTGLGQLDTPYRIALANKLSSVSSDEEIRILYVALTRARDKLYIVSSGTEGYAEKYLASALRRTSIGGRFSVANTSCLLERILLGLAADPLNRSYVIETPQIDLLSSEDAEAGDTYVPNEEKIKLLCEELRPSLNFEYQYSDTALIPAKMSVSRLYPELLNEAEDPSGIACRIEAMEPRTPRFMGGGNGATEKGTATHLFMQFCDFSKLEPTTLSIDNEIARLVEEKYIPKNIAELVRTRELAAFVATEFFKNVLDAKVLYRELRFNVFLPASDFTDIAERKNNLEEENILVQGVIDLCMIGHDGELILCDYKTDRLSPDALKDRNIATKILQERHGQQLRYYSKAIEIIMGRRPDKIFVYSLAFGDALEILL